MKRNELQVQSSPRIPNPNKIRTPEELHETVRSTAVAIKQLWRKETITDRRVAALEKISERHWFHDLEVYNYNNSVILPVRLQQDRDGDTGICMGCKDTLRWALAIDQSQSVFKISPECPVTGDYYFAMNMEGQIRVGAGVWIDDFSDDETFADLSATALVTERAIAVYIAAVTYWDRDVAGYVFPRTITDSIGIGIAAPVSLLEIWDNDADPILTISAERDDIDPQIQYRINDPLAIVASTGVDGLRDYYIIDIGAGGVRGSTDFVFNAVGLGIGVNPTARLNLAAGTAVAGTSPLKFTGGVALAVPEAGVLEFHDDRLYLTNIAVRRAVDRTSCVEITTTTVTNTAVETTIYTCPNAANSLRVGNHIHIEASGIITTATAADDITIRVYVGADLINTYNPAIGNIAGADWHAELDVTIRTIGGAGTIASHGHVEIDGNEDVANELDVINTAVANDITITVEWDNAKAGNVISLYQGTAHWSN